MGRTINLKKGYNLKIVGEPEQTLNTDVKVRTYAVKPTDFNGLSPIPKMLVQVGDEVKAGTPLFFDKKLPEIMFCSPVSGEVAEIKRGAKRAIIEVVILADKKNTYLKLDTINPDNASREAIIEHLLKTGLWPFLRQRPFNVVAGIDEAPKAIFISGFNTGPLAPDLNFTLKGEAAAFQTGVNVLKRLSKGKVHLSLDGANTCDTLSNVKGVEQHTFKGKHPAGNVGIQIHHIDPINKGDIVWTVDPQDVITIGRVFKDGEFNTERLYAIGGPVVKKPSYFKAFQGAAIEGIAKNNLSTDHVRYISGDVLTGRKVDIKGHFGAFDKILTVLEEGDKYELFGWLLPSYPRPSISRSFLSFLKPNKQFNVNTNSHGEHRGMVVTGAFEQVTPMDIYPMQLLKAIMARDFDLMEGLGIYEVVEEDFALCEFVCPSKTDVQEILREGLDYMREQA